MRYGSWVGCGFAFISIAMMGCSGMSNTAKGGLIGGGLGAGLGTAIGSMSGNPGAGAIIGGGIGTVTGGLIGNDIDTEDKNRQEARVIQAEATAAAAASQPMGITDVAQMAKQGFGDQVIINQLRSTNSTFQLSTTDLQWLRENGVSDGVVIFMQQSRRTALPPRVIVQEAPPIIYTRPARPVYIVQPPPPPPPLGFGFSYTQIR